MAKTLQNESTSGTVGALVAYAARTYGERCAVEEGGLRLSYSGLDLARTRAAAAFLAAGVARGDRVAVWAPNGVEWIVAALGLQSVGAVLVPVNTRLKGAECAALLNRSRARLLLTVGQFLGIDYVGLLRDQALRHLEGVVVLGEPSSAGASVEGVPVTGWQAFLAGGADVAPVRVRARMDEVRADDVADILFTSGTTGQPRGVPMTHGQNLRTFDTWASLVGLSSRDRYLIVNPFFHAFGYKAGWLACLMRGATILPHAVFDPAAVLERVDRDTVSVLPGPPSLYQALLERVDRSRHRLTSLRLAVTGAAVIPVSLIESMRRELGFETVVTGYGLTESCGVATMCRDGDDAETIATTSGRAIDGVEVRCVDGQGKAVASGEPGEVLVRGFNVMRGYFDDPEGTREALDPGGWLHTGDIGVMDASGYLRITDRKKDIFIMGGFNCYPAEIENLMLENRDFAQVAVIGIPDPRMGEVGMAFVLPAQGAQPDEASVMAWCREHMANYKVPRRVAFVEALPLNASGKVLKSELRKWAARP